MNQDFWIDKFITLFIASLGVFFTWFAIQWKKIAKSSFDEAFEEHIVPFNKRLERMEDIVTDLKVYKEVSEKLDKAKDRALYGKNL